MDTLDDHIQTLLNRKSPRRASSSSSGGPFQRTGSFIFTSSFTDKVPDDRHDSFSSADWVQVEDIITTMESLAFHCKQGKRCCNCIITCYRVAQVGKVQSKATSLTQCETCYLLCKHFCNQLLHFSNAKAGFKSFQSMSSLANLAPKVFSAFNQVEREDCGKYECCRSHDLKHFHMPPVWYQKRLLGFSM